MSWNHECMAATCTPQEPIIKVINVSYRSYDAQRKSDARKT